MDLFNCHCFTANAERGARVAAYGQRRKTAKRMRLMPARGGGCLRWGLKWTFGLAILCLPTTTPAATGVSGTVNSDATWTVARSPYAPSDTVGAATANDYGTFNQVVAGKCPTGMDLRGPGDPADQ